MTIDQIMQFARQTLSEDAIRVMSGLAMQLAGTYEIWAPFALPFSFAVLAAAVAGIGVLIHILARARRHG